ncbi:TPA: hypothetical protein N0F65_009486 [Lagenidium giganteum]|uniref:Protein kinase domain-containing protein n=1 Tax=Lagenidium giganteum TaxID=4803 RepID=A0AAV2ZD85_9STRA|nr:TPA: hypothetical protein N0F65_009486 [Lagenidium giganteum]
MKRSETEKRLIPEHQVATAIQVAGGHPNVIWYHESRIHNNLLWQTMEYCGGQNLQDIVEQAPNHRISSLESLHYIRQIARGLEFLHSLSIAHLGISLDNVFVDADMHCKLLGFKYSRESTCNCEQFVGNPVYLAPEVLALKTYHPMKADVWALGILLCILLTGCSPIALDSRWTQILELYGCRKPVEVWISANAADVDEDVIEVLKLMLQVDPASRPSVAEVLRVLPMR